MRGENLSGFAEVYCKKGLEFEGGCCNQTCEEANLSEVARCRKTTAVKGFKCGYDNLIKFATAVDQGEIIIHPYKTCDHSMLCNFNNNDCFGAKKERREKFQCNPSLIAGKSLEKC